MQRLFHTYIVATFFLPLAPLIIASVAGFVSSRVAKQKWLVHLAAFLMIVFTPYAWLRIGSLIDRTFLDDHTNAGEAFGLGMLLLFYLFTAVITMICYALFAWSTRSRPKIAAAAR